MKLNIFTSTIRDGIMSKDKKYFPSLSKKEIEDLYQLNVDRYFEKLNIKNKNIVFLTEKNNKLKSRVVTKDSKVIKEKILILKDTEKDVAVAIETADSPIIIGNVTAEDGSMTSAIALLTLENLNEGIIHELIEALIKQTDEAPFNMTFYISATLSKENYILDDISNLTDSYIWKGCIEKKNKKYQLDIRYSIFNQLIAEIVDPNYIFFDQTDTKEDSKFFSNYSNKQGKNLICVVYTDEEV